MDINDKGALGVNLQKDHFASEHVIVSAHSLVVEKFSHWECQLLPSKTVQQLVVVFVILIKVSQLVSFLWQLVNIPIFTTLLASIDFTVSPQPLILDPSRTIFKPLATICLPRLLAFLYLGRPLSFLLIIIRLSLLKHELTLSFLSLLCS